MLKFMKNKNLVVVLVLACAVSFGAGMAAGGLSHSELITGFNEMGQRFYRDANNQIMIGSFSDEGYWYFQGRMEARAEDAQMLLKLQETGGL